ncbi:uncharacterized protein Dwil_GK21143 [Drosophila willistoni]|uniref:Potassium channel domain-containing protein n=1 Tax=Drosophila willistoni TaxID=7260 RepID=B4MXY6_DROWI|nr:uncharacterized protein LOC6643187 [Drosophila willistoni]EDW76975.1 uncharacterized protein Dwil_GK21143 [Drosophila willistoni]
MSGRRAQSLPPHMLEPAKPQRGPCVTAICFSWKILTCIVSHVLLVLLVVSYCVGGAYLFQHLEGPHEVEVKQSVRHLRFNLTERIWLLSDDAVVLRENDWIANVSKHLANFEKDILTAIKAGGWDGDEDLRKSQWTFAGSLFYSIIVITTIGYGHISPRTDWGKVTTIFYAIVGIPLMLLCLSNIGDVMATSFRFLYWRICCYVCTRTAKRPRNQRSRQRSMRSHRNSSRSQPPPSSFRRSIRMTQRSGNDSGLGPSMGHAYSDPELRGRYEDREFNYRGSSGRSRRQQQQHYNHEQRHRHTIYGDEYEPQTQTLNRSSRYSSRQRHRDRMRDRHTVERERYLGQSRYHVDDESIDDFSDMQPPAKRAASVRSVRSPQRQDARASRELHRLHSAPGRGRAKSVDPRHVSSSHYEDVDEDVVRKTPIIPNRYVLDEFEGSRGVRNAPRSQSMPRSAHQRQRQRERGQSPQPPPANHRHNRRRAGSLGRQSSRYGNHLELPDYDAAPQPNQRDHRHRRGRSPRYGEDYVEESFDDASVCDSHYEDYPPPQSSRELRRERRRERSERLPPSPRIMSPMGFPVQRQIRRRPSYDYDEDDSQCGDDDYYGNILPKDRPVPIWLCVFLVVSYILGGAVLFAAWENWSYLDSAYFCFITLTTIGFGDFVPAKGVKDESEQSIAYCSLYLLFGIALLAMSFNLVQEEFIANVKEVARRLGILKDDDDDDQDED